MPPEVHLFEPTGYAGIFQHAYRMAELLRDDGLQVVLHTGHEHESLEERAGIVVCSCSWWPRSGPRSVRRSLAITERYLVRTLPHLRAVAPRGSVVHLQGTAATGALNLVAMLVARLAGRRVVYSPHDTFSRRGGLDGRLLRLALHVPHAVVVHTQRDVEALSTAGIRTCYSPLVQVVPDPAPDQREGWRREWGAAEDDEVVLFAGWIRPEKRLDLLVESAAHWPSRRRLAVLGQDRGGWENTAALARDRGVEVAARVEFVELERFASAIAAADVVVAPHERASQSGVLSLARTLGVPSVAADVGGLAELATRTFRSGDADSLTRALDEELARERPRPRGLDETTAVAAHRRAYDLDRAPVGAADARRRLMGMPLDAVTFARAVERVEGGLRTGHGGAVLTPNLDILRQHHRSPAVREALDGAELLVADGVPLVWAARVQGTPVPERITGTDMLWGAAALAARGGHRLAIAGGRPDQGPRAARRLRELYPGLRVDAHPCYVRPADHQRQLCELAGVLEAAAPDVVLIALPFLAQIGLIAETRPRLPATWFIGIGSSCDFVNGDRPRAPGWLQRAGLEWAHRLVHEPGTAHRYLVDGLPFAARLAAHVVKARLAPGPVALRGEPGVS